MIDTDKLKSLKNEAKSIKPSLIVGKSGLSETMIQQIKLYIKSNKLCKVKLSRNFLDSQELTKKEISSELVERTGS